VKCELESRDLLSICLKKIKGLSKVKLVDASFLYTEPHSRRLKLKLTVQREVTIGTVLQQSIVVEAVVQTLQCSECKKTFTPHTWNCMVQLRQKVEHKRTMFHLEQLILKYNAHEKVIGVRSRPDGLDFQFQANSHMRGFGEFVKSTFPTQTKDSKQLVSHDSKSNTYNYKYTTMIELCPVCKDDLVLLAPKEQKNFGGISPLLACTSVGETVHLIDARTARTVHINGTEYWKQGFKSVCTRRHLQEYVVLDVEIAVDGARRKVKPLSSKRAGHRRWQLCEVEIVRESDMGTPDASVKVFCHLGNLLQPGDLCLGYDLRQVNVDGISSEELDKQQNDIIIVKKAWRRKEEFRNRAWKLKHLDKQVEEGEEEDSERLAREEEEYKRDIEEDEDLQKEVQLWKDPAYVPRAPVEGEEEEEDIPEVALAQLLEDLSIND
jgi:nonsense-mediated mRNA decay protein 3